MKIVAVRKESGTNNLTEFKADDGKEYSYNEMITLVGAGKVEGVMLGANKYEEPTIKGTPDGDPNNNLSNLPSF